MEAALQKYRNIHLLWPIFGLAAAGWNVIRWYALRITDGSDEPLGCFALVACAWFALGRRNEFTISHRRLLVACMALLAFAALPQEVPPMLRALAWIFAVGILTARSAAWAGLLVYSLPVMASAQFFAGYPLRVAVTWAASQLLRVVGLAVVPTGTMMSWHHQQVLIDAPCSGLQMAWLAGLLALVVANQNRFAFGACAKLLVFTGAVTWAANVLRAAALFILETQLHVSAEWMHDVVGLTLFAAVIALVLWCAMGLKSRSGQPASGARCGTMVTQPIRFGWCEGVPLRLRAAAWPAFFLLALTAAIRPALGGTAVVEKKLQPDFPGWETAPLFTAIGPDGGAFQRLALDVRTQRFADDFPGKIGVFSDGRRTWIVRWVYRPTRKLHSAMDCLRAAGYAVEPGRALRDGRGWLWSSFRARHAHEDWLVTERIVDANGQAWTDVSAWFWENSFRSGAIRGPWWAVTQLEPSQAPTGADSG